MLEGENKRQGRRFADPKCAGPVFANLTASKGTSKEAPQNIPDSAAPCGTL